MEGLEESKNHSVRTLAAFLGATAIGLLSYARDVYAERDAGGNGALHSKTDDIVNSLFFLGFLFALSVAALRRPQENTGIADFILSLSFVTITFGTVIFIWGNMPKPVSISFSVGLSLLAVGYATCADSGPDQEGGNPLKSARLWLQRYRGLTKPQ